MPRRETIQVRRGTAAQWTAANPTLASGEVGFETDTFKAKIGDGSTVWTSLRYQGIIPASTAAGDLAYYSAANTPSRLAIGTAYQVLRTNSGATAPEWVSGGMQLIEEKTGANTSYDFTSIPSTFRHLKLEFQLRTDKVATTENIYTSFNADTTDANYDEQYLSAEAGATIPAQNLAAAGARTGMVATAASSPANQYATGTTEIPYYASSNFKSLITDSMVWAARTSGNAKHVFSVVGWANTTAISRITITPAGGTNFSSGSRVALYGIG